MRIESVKNLDHQITKLKKKGLQVNIYSTPITIIIKNNYYKINPGDFIALKEMFGKENRKFPIIKDESLYTWLELIFSMPPLIYHVSGKVFISVSKGAYIRNFDYSRDPEQFERFADSITPILKNKKWWR